MSEKKLHKQNFLQGAFILAAANIYVKLVGGLFKIPLVRFILGPDGIGIYNASYTIYNVLFIISTAGLPVAISKMVSESAARGNYKEVGRIFRIAQMLLFTIGILGAVILFFGANTFAADVIKSPSSAMSILAMAPSLFFVSVMSVYRGYFQGMSNMTPTAASECIEASGKLFIGLFLAWMLLPNGKPMASAGAVLGVSTGTFLGAVALVGYYFSQRKKLRAMAQESTSVSPMGKKQLLIRLIKLAVPITIGASVFTLASAIDLFMIMRQLARLGFDETARETMYGYYSGYAVTMFNLPPGVFTALCISAVPAVAGALAKKDMQTAKKTTETAFRITFLLALPCAVGMSVLSAPILQLVFDDVGASTLLAILSYGILFVSIVLVSNAVLQAAGKVWIPVRNMLIGGIVKVVVNYILVGNINININGAPVGTDLCYLTTALLNLIAIRKYLGASYGVSFLIKTTFSAAIMGLAAYLSYHALTMVIASNMIALSAAIILAVLVYGALLLATKSLVRQDIEFMPKSDKLLKLFGRFL